MRRIVLAIAAAATLSVTAAACGTDEPAPTEAGADRADSAPDPKDEAEANVTDDEAPEADQSSPSDDSADGEAPGEIDPAGSGDPEEADPADTDGAEAVVGEADEDPLDDPVAPEDEIPGLDEMDEILAAATDALPGMDLPSAEAWAAERGLSIRVLEEDGQLLAATMDFVTNRVNVAVSNGVITGVLNVG